MQLTVYRTNIDATPSLLEYIDTRISKSLDRMADHVQEITIRMADVNGPRGGEDKSCSVSITLASRHNALITQTDRCMYKAIDKVTTRLKQVVRKNVRRKIKSRRRHRPVKY